MKAKVFNLGQDLKNHEECQVEIIANIICTLRHLREIGKMKNITKLKICDYLVREGYASNEVRAMRLTAVVLHSFNVMNYLEKRLPKNGILNPKMLARIIDFAPFNEQQLLLGLKMLNSERILPIPNAAKTKGVYNFYQ